METRDIRRNLAVVF